jgi:WD40 repeat protein
LLHRISLHRTVITFIIIIMSTFGMSSPVPTRPGSIAPNDHSVSQPGNDGVSTLTWSPTANILVSGNWDSGIRCWEVQVQEQTGQIMATPKAQGTLLHFGIPCVRAKPSQRRDDGSVMDVKASADRALRPARWRPTNALLLMADNDFISRISLIFLLLSLFFVSFRQ